jgi:hypothetical protein
MGETSRPRRNPFISVSEMPEPAPSTPAPDILSTSFDLSMLSDCEVGEFHSPIRLSMAPIVSSTETVLTLAGRGHGVGARGRH